MQNAHECCFGTKRNNAGLLIIETLIILVVIAVLTLAILPNFQSYVGAAKFAEVVHACSAVRDAVDVCIVTQGNTTDCTAGTYGVPQNQTSFPASTNVSSVSVANGVITGTAVASLNNATYIMTPTRTSDGVVTWCASGTCSQYGYCPVSSCDGVSVPSSTNSGGGSTYTASQQFTLDQCKGWTGYCSVSHGECFCVASDEIVLDDSIKTGLEYCQRVYMPRIVGDEGASAGCVLMP